MKWLLLLSLFAYAEEVEVTAQDIENLAAKKTWNEAMMKLEEVPAAERGKGWEALVEKVAVGYLKSIADEALSNAMQIASSLPETHTSLKKSKKYADTVETIAYTGFSECFKQKESEAECTRNLREYVEKNVQPSARKQSRFCKDAGMKRALASLCPDAQGKRP